MAGITKRTIDYYTSLDLLKPVRSDSNYRYYTEETLVRLKLIEDMKMKRFTLEEIKEQMNLLDGNLSEIKMENECGMVNKEFLKEKVKHLEKQLENKIFEIQPMIANLDSSQAALSTKQALLQSLTLIQTMVLYINEIISFL